MKNYFILCLFFLLNLPIRSVAQEEVTQEPNIQLGLKLGSETQLNFFLKKPLKANNLVLRGQLKSLFFDFSKLGQINTNTFSFSTLVGLEQQKKIIDDLFWLYGGELGFGVVNSKTGQINQTIYASRIGGVLGFQYNINKVLTINAEIAPHISVNYNPSKTNNKEKFMSKTVNLQEVTFGVLFNL